MRAPGWYGAFLVGNMAMGAASALLPLYAYFLGGTAADVGALAAVGSLTNVLASLFWGKLADRTRRRRPFVVLSFAGFALAYGLLPLVGRPGPLYPLNVWVAFTWMASAQMAILFLLSSLPRELWERELGRFNAYCGVGWTLGLALGAVWVTVLVPLTGEAWGLRSLGVVVATLALVATGLAGRSIKDTGGKVEAPAFREFAATMGGYLYEILRYGPVQLYEVLRPSQVVRFLQGKTVFGPDLILVYYAGLLTFVGFSMVFAPFPVFVRQKLLWPNEFVFALYVAHHGVSVVAFSWARKAVARWGHRPVASLALVSRAGMFSALVFMGSGAKWALPALFGLFGATWAMFHLAMTAVVSRLSPAGQQGQGLGLYNAVAGLGSVLGSLGGGFLAEWIGFPAAFLSGAALLVLTLPILLVEGRPVP